MSAYNTVLASLITVGLYDSGIAQKVAEGLGPGLTDRRSYDAISLTPAIKQEDGTWVPSDPSQPVTHRISIGPVREEFSMQAIALHASPQMLEQALSQRMGADAPTESECQRFCQESYLFIGKLLEEILDMYNLVRISI